MSRRAMTLVEVLLSLALLTALALACAAWTATTTRSLATIGGAADWRAGADAALAFVGDCLLAGDESGRGERAAAEGRALVVSTRLVVAEPGRPPTLCPAVRIELAEGLLSAGYLDAAGDIARWRPLVGEVQRLEITTSPGDDPRGPGLTVALVGPKGATASRTWSLAEGANP